MCRVISPPFTAECECKIIVKQNDKKWMEPGTGVTRVLGLVLFFVWFKHILFMTEDDKGLGRAKKLC